MRSNSLAMVLVLVTVSAPAAALAQEAPMDRATADVQLESMRHELGTIDDGLFRVREALMLMGVRSITETGAARLVLTYEDHFAGLAPTVATFSTRRAIASAFSPARRSRRRSARPCTCRSSATTPRRSPRSRSAPPSTTSSPPTQRPTDGATDPSCRAPLGGSPPRPCAALLRAPSARV